MTTHQNLITIYTPILEPYGIGRMLVNHIQELRRRGLNVDILYEKNNFPTLPFTEKDITLVQVAHGGALVNLLQLSSYLRRRRPAVLRVIHKPRAVRQAVTARRLSGVDTRIFVTVHNHLSSRLLQDKSPRRQKRIVNKIQRYWPLCDGIIAVSKGVAEDVSKLSGIDSDKIHVVHNPTVTRTLFLKAREDIQESIPGGNKTPFILSVGRLDPQKDYPTLIRAFSLIHDRVQHNLIILGEGNRRRELERLISELQLDDRVFLPGYHENPYAYMQRASLFVMSSVWEGLPNVLIEALAVGCPVVSTNCPSGPNEILENGRYGSLVPVGDADALATSIFDTLSAPTDDALLRGAVTGYTPEKSLDLYLDIYGLA